MYCPKCGHNNPDDKSGTNDDTKLSINPEVLSLTE